VNKRTAGIRGIHGQIRRQDKAAGCGGEADDEDMLGVGRGRDGLSNAGTPRPGDAPTPMMDLRGSNAMTPTTLPEGSGRTPKAADEDVDMDAGPADEGKGEGVSNAGGERAGDDMDTT